MPRLLNLFLCCSDSNDGELQSDVNTALALHDNEDIFHNKSEKCRHCIKFSKCLISTVVVNITLLAVLAYLSISLCHYNPENTNKRIHEDTTDNCVFLPCHDNVTADGSTTYCKYNATRAILYLVTLLSTEFAGRRNLSVDPTERDQNRPILKQKFSELYFVEKSNTTGTLHLFLTQHSNLVSSTDQTNITVSSDGIYLVYASLQYCVRKSNQPIETVSMEVRRQSGETSSVIYRNHLRLTSGMQAFIPGNVLFPVKLTRGNALSLRGSSSNLYDMRVGNIFGVHEVRKTESYI